MVPPDDALRIKRMKKIARSLREHRELILDYFYAQKLTDCVEFADREKLVRTLAAWLASTSALLWGRRGFLPA